MPSAGVLAAAALAAMLFLGGRGVVHGIKKAGHAVACVFHHGKTCAK
jgi:hypothetical protein